MQLALRCLAICSFLLAVGAPHLRALDARTHVSQYGHTAWRVRDGALSAPPSSIAQTPDGFLWFGTDAGLLHFDGVSFAHWTPPHWDEITTPGIHALFTSSDGTLWIGTTAGLAFWKDQKLTVIHAPNIERVTQIAEDPQHHIWFTLAKEADRILCSIQGDNVRCFGKADGLTVRHGEYLDISREGVITVASQDLVNEWRPEHGLLSSHVFDPLTRLHSSHGIVALERETDGSKLIGMAYAGKGLGLQQLRGNASSAFMMGKFDGSSLQVQALFTDHSGALWIGTQSDGLYKVTGGTVDHYTANEGLSGNSVSDFCEDHEGNLWVVTDGGVDEFHDLKIITWSTQEGLSAGFVQSVLALHDGSVLVTKFSGTIDVLRNGSVTSLVRPAWVPTGAAQALMEDGAGRIWISVGSELLVYDGQNFSAVKQPSGKPFGVVSSLTQSADGTVWARVVQHPGAVVHIVDEKVKDSFTAPALGYALASDGEHGVWVGGDNNINHYSSGKLTTVPLPIDHNREQFLVENSLISGNEGVLYTSSSLGVWAVQSNRAQRLGTSNGLPCGAVAGLLLSRTNSLFAQSACGLIQVTPEELHAWLTDSKLLIHPKVIDVLDGYNASMGTYFPLMSQASDGRIWIANESSVQVFDPARSMNNRVPPPVHIEEVVADNVSFKPEPELSLPALSRDIQIRYVGLSLSVPQKVHFRYKLEGQDSGWQEPGTRRTAYYQNLKPGHYRFQVVAANNDDVWNETGDTLELNIKPAWFQTVWWRLLWISAACVLLWSLYRLRVRSIANAISARFDVRLDERTRMALELHDTFLQTVQGSKMVADDALDPSSDQVRMRHALERLSVWLGQAVTEGRAALHALRVSTTERNHLAEFLERTAREQCQRASISVALTVVGDAIDLHPIVRDEIARIAEEAIRNAVLHSRGNQLSIELLYGSDLSLSFEDNGVGIDPEIADAGKSGHFGILGMRERSARIGARIHIVSTLSAGTSLKLRVPGNVVYRRREPALLMNLRKMKLWRARPADVSRKK